MGIRALGRRGVLIGAAALAGCQQAGTSSQTGTAQQAGASVKPPPLPPGAAVPPENVPLRLGSGGTGYIEVAAVITPQVRDLFIRDVNRYLDLGATEIYVMVNSPGGVIDAAQDMIAFIETTQSARRARFTMHNTGLVGSAACYVFLAGQRRLSVPRGSFLFHEAGLLTIGMMSSQRLREENAKMQQVERTFLNMLTRRTRLKQAEALSFVRRTVVLNATEAERDGVIQEVAPLRLPPDATVIRMRSRPAGTNAPRPGS